MECGHLDDRSTETYPLSALPLMMIHWWVYSPAGYVSVLLSSRCPHSIRSDRGPSEWNVDTSMIGARKRILRESIPTSESSSEVSNIYIFVSISLCLLPLSPSLPSPVICSIVNTVFCRNRGPSEWNVDTSMIGARKRILRESIPTSESSCLLPLSPSLPSPVICSIVNTVFLCPPIRITSDDECGHLDDRSTETYPAGEYTHQ
jgi:hypothetical protein